MDVLTIMHKLSKVSSENKYTQRTRDVAKEARTELFNLYTFK